MFFKFHRIASRGISQRVGEFWGLREGKEGLRMFFLFFLKNFLKNYCVERAGAGGYLLLGGMGYFVRWNT